MYWLIRGLMSEGVFRQSLIISVRYFFGSHAHSVITKDTTVSWDPAEDYVVIVSS